MRELEFDRGTVSLPALQRACHQLSGDADLAVETGGADRWLVKIYGEVDTAAGAELERRLRSAVIDFSLREQIEARTHAIRETLVQIALAEATPRR